MRHFLLPLLSIICLVAARSAVVAAPSTDTRQMTGAQTALTTPSPNAAGTPHAGYPTSREKWRYCPLEGSHQCVDLDIPGVTEPDTAAPTTAKP